MGHRSSELAALLLYKHIPNATSTNGLIFDVITSVCVSQSINGCSKLEFTFWQQQQQQRHGQKLNLG